MFYADHMRISGGFVLCVAAGGWLLYNFLYDDTRRGHPNYETGSAHKICSKVARTISDENLGEALSDPSLWQLGGYKSANDMAKGSYSLAYALCMD